MAFIKRSTIKAVHAKVGKSMTKCSSCGQPFMSKALAILCPACNPNSARNEEDCGKTPDCCTESDLDQE